MQYLPTKIQYKSLKAQLLANFQRTQQFIFIDIGAISPTVELYERPFVNLNTMSANLNQSEVSINAEHRPCFATGI